MHALTLLLLLLLPGAVLASDGPPPLVLEAVVSEPYDGPLIRAVEAQLRLRAGQEISVEEMITAEGRLRASGFFAEVDLHTRRGARPGAIVMVVTGRLDRSAHLESGFGHEPLHGWYLNLVGVRWNSPLRRGGYLRTGVRLGLRTSAYYAEWMRPRLLDRDLALLAELNAGTDRWLAVDGDDLYFQRIDQGRFRIGLRAGLSSNVDLTLWGGGRNVAPEATLEGVGVPDEPAGRLVPVPGEREKFNEQSLELRWRPAPAGERWRHGRAAALRLSALQGRDSALELGAFAGELGAAVPLFERDALAVRFKGSTTTPGTPYHLRPVFGGTGSLRGFRDASLSGPLGARASWLASLEWRRRILTSDDGRARVVGQAFVDVGRHWDAQGVDGGLSSSLGYGLRFRVPWIQVFGVDVGIPLSVPTTADEFWVHATLGFSF